jgi:hypothetical protein
MQTGMARMVSQLQSITRHTPGPEFQSRLGMDTVPPMVFVQGEGSDILDAIIAEGRCGTCGTPRDRVVKVDGKRPVKIEGGCPNDVCVLGDW